MHHLYVPDGNTRTEITVVNSRFIASLGPAFSVEQARDFIARVKIEFQDASHNVPAFIIGHGASVIAHCNDDGEPSGTAGRPVLSVLQGSRLGDVVIVITRYFGGTKLGKGGLVRAYGDAARQAIQKTPLAEKVATHTVMFAVPYRLYEPVKIIINRYKAQILDEIFAGDVTITGRFRTEDFDLFQSQLTEMSKGTVKALIIETNQDTLLPVSTKIETANPSGEN